MAKIFFDHRQPFRLFSRRKKTAGFTLLELLAALAVGSIITIGLLAFLIQLLQANQRDAARSDTQRDIQAALDYIARDVREAVYVYDGECLTTPSSYTPATDCPGLRNYLPPEVAGTATNAANLPVLAFWRVDPLPEPLLARCVSNAGAFSNGSGSAFPAAIQGVPCLSRRMYTLVVYSLNWEQRDSVRGRARITRYQLPQYSYRRGSTIDTPPVTTPGWVDPVGRDTNFFMWPIDKAAASTGTIQSLQTSPPQATWGANHLVLVDYVDRQGIYGGNATCPTTPPSTTAGATTTEGELYRLTPGQATNRGFYVCVKGSPDQGALNQEVIVRIQGEAANRPGIPDSNPTRPIVSVPMETRVLTRGVLNKTQ